MLMTSPEVDRKFEVRIPIDLWDQWERWLDGRGRVTNVQMMSAFIRLFLAAPEPTQLQALFGRQKEVGRFTGDGTTAAAIPDDEALAQETVQGALRDEAEIGHRSVGRDAKSPQAARDRRTRR